MFIRQKKESKKEFRLGVGGKLVLNVVIPLIVILAVLAVTITIQVTNTTYRLKNTDMLNQTNATTTQITEYFDGFFTSGKYVMDRDSVHQLFREI